MRGHLRLRICYRSGAERTPLSALRLGDMHMEAGVPAGVVNVLPSPGPTAGVGSVAVRGHGGDYRRCAWFFAELGQDSRRQDRGLRRSRRALDQLRDQRADGRRRVQTVLKTGVRSNASAETPRRAPHSRRERSGGTWHERPRGPSSIPSARARRRRDGVHPRAA